MNEALRTALKELRLSGMTQSLEVRLQEAAGIVPATLQQQGIQFVKISDLRHRDQEVQTAVFYRSFNHPLLIGSPNKAEMVVKQIVTD